MDNIFVVAGVISVIFLLAKFIEMRMVEKESKPLKLLVRDAFFVYFSVLSGNFILDQLKPTMESAMTSVPSVFTDNPSF